MIYGLIDPVTRAIRYVGKSTSGLARPRAHGSPSGLKIRSHRTSWILSLKKQGLDYEIVVLESPQDRSALAAAERWWIAFGRACGWTLTNHTDGGEGSLGLRHTAESLAKMSAASRGRIPSAETRAKLSASSKGRKLSREARAKLSAANTGRKLSPEQRAKLSAAHKGYRYSEEACARMSEQRKGRKYSPAARANISAAAKVRASTERSRAQLDAARQARWSKYGARP